MREVRAGPHRQHREPLAEVVIALTKDAARERDLKKQKGGRHVHLHRPPPVTIIVRSTEYCVGSYEYLGT